MKKIFKTIAQEILVKLKEWNEVVFLRNPVVKLDKTLFKFNSFLDKLLDKAYANSSEEMFDAFRLSFGPDLNHYTDRQLEILKKYCDKMYFDWYLMCEEVEWDKLYPFLADETRRLQKCSMPMECKNNIEHMECPI